MIFKTHPFISHIIFLVSGRNHLTCANLTSGHILGLSARLSPSLTSSHSHIYIYHWVAIRPAQLAHLTFHLFLMWPLLELSARLSSRFHISEGYPPGSAPLSHISSHHSFMPYRHAQFTFHIHVSLHITSITIHIYNSHFNSCLIHFPPFSINSHKYA